MTPEEATEIAFRLKKFEKAEQRIAKLDKAKLVVEAIASGEHNNIESIVIDVRCRQIKYTSQGDARLYAICAFTNEDQKEMVADFISYALKQITDRIDAAKAEMLEA